MTNRFLVVAAVLSLLALSTFAPFPYIYLRPYFFLLCAIAITCAERPIVRSYHLIVGGLVVAVVAMLPTLGISIIEPSAGVVIFASLILIVLVEWVALHKPQTTSYAFTYALLGLITASFIILTPSLLAELSYIHGATRAKSQDLNTTISDFYDATKKNPRVGRYQTALARSHLLAATQYARQSNPTEEQTKLMTEHIRLAITFAQNAVSSEHGSGESWSELGYIYRSLIGPIPDAGLWAQASYERAIAKDPNNPDYPLLLAQVQSIGGNRHSAEAVLKNQMSRFPKDARYPYMLGHILEKSDPKAALVWYKSALSLASLTDKPLVQSRIDKLQ